MQLFQSTNMLNFVSIQLNKPVGNASFHMSGIMLLTKRKGDSPEYQQIHPLAHKRKDLSIEGGNRFPTTGPSRIEPQAPNLLSKHSFHLIRHHSPKKLKIPSGSYVFINVLWILAASPISAFFFPTSFPSLDDSIFHPLQDPPNYPDLKGSVQIPTAPWNFLTFQLAPRPLWSPTGGSWHLLNIH